LFVFGFIYWLLDNIQVHFRDLSEKGDVFDILKYFWTGIIIIYLILGGYWVVRKYTEREYTFGGVYR